MQVNDLIFKELIKRGYSLEGKTRVWNIADSKLWYLTPEQAQGFLDLEENKEYKKSVIEKEISLLKKHIPNLLKMFSSSAYNLIDLGCGDGNKAAIFLKELKNKLTLRYCPVDISAYMVGKAAQRIRKLNLSPVLEFRANISDFENLNNVTPVFRDAKFKHHCLLLLGNTYGNFDSQDILGGISGSMVEGDFLIIGNSLREDLSEENLIRPYQDPLLEKFLMSLVKQIGLKSSDVSYSVRFKDSRVEMMYTLKRKKTIKHADRIVNFEVGDKIISVVSIRYSKKEIMSNLLRFFPNVNLYTDEQDTYVLVICAK